MFLSFKSIPLNQNLNQLRNEHPNLRARNKLHRKYLKFILVPDDNHLQNWANNQLHPQHLWSPEFFHRLSIHASVKAVKHQCLHFNHILHRNFSGCWKAPCEHQCRTFTLFQVLFHTGNIHCHHQGMTVSAVLSSWHRGPPAFHSGTYSTAFHKPSISYLWSAWVAQQTVSSSIIYPCSGLTCKTLIPFFRIFIYV